jgi:hypothetical protein
MEERNCKSIRDNLLWDYAAQRLTPAESDAVDAHLSVCRECETSFIDFSSMSRGFRHLPHASMPPLVGTSLQVLASRERSRRLLRLDPAAWLRDKLISIKVSIDNLLRPFAVPATGGILASCLCFSLIAHTLQLRPYMIGEDDMPVALYTQVMIDDLSPFSFSKSQKDVTVQLTVDANGKVTDFATPQGNNPTPDDLRQIGSLVLYSTFTPATRFGQRVSSKVLFAISHVSVRD